jgi:hypothetical protein
MALHSNADLLFHNGTVPVSSVFDLSFQFLILHLLISLCKQFHHLFLAVLLVDFPGIIIKYLAYFSFTTHSINMASVLSLKLRSDPNCVEVLWEIFGSTSFLSMQLYGALCYFICEESKDTFSTFCQNILNYILLLQVRYGISDPHNVPWP